VTLGCGGVETTLYIRFGVGGLCLEKLICDLKPGSFFSFPGRTLLRIAGRLDPLPIRLWAAAGLRHLAID